MNTKRRSCNRSIPAVLSACLLTGCGTSVIPSKDFDLADAPPEISAPCIWPDPPRSGDAPSLQSGLVRAYAALADCIEKRRAERDHYQRQNEAVRKALSE